MSIECTCNVMAVNRYCYCMLLLLEMVCLVIVLELMEIKTLGSKKPTADSDSIKYFEKQFTLM